MQKNFFTKIAVIVVLSALALSGCSENNSFVPPPVVVVPPPPVPPPPPPPPPPTPQQSFGAGFEAAFGQTRFAEPLEPRMGSIIPLDKSADPIAVPDPK